MANSPWKGVAEEWNPIVADGLPIPIAGSAQDENYGAQDPTNVGGRQTNVGGESPDPWEWPFLQPVISGIQPVLFGWRSAFRAARVATARWLA
ncbi:uncharacterized protein KD926_003909 [Aspergillus affinis]|uniref:uncharacterized protein n=1 Tax=Aspergillus affinis TaxID=1070780 RepID=UPI0022FE2A82|nr:uncharacterized protein KD926_003909 [Aspergillus affinis]KAI9043379.1 hypothetical protein KD926_003909 [Aspergillus affinis]